MSTAVNRARRQQTCAELQRLRTDLQQWLDHRKEPDVFENAYRGQHDSQLAAVNSEVTAAIDAVAATLDFDLSSLSSGQVYAKLARADQQIIWIRRAWDFFRMKFDQRDSRSLSRALAAADEVLWSCYKPFFQRSQIARPPLPLAYIEVDYLPSAILASQGHQIERLDENDDGPLAGYFDSLPLPVLRLPPMIVSAPWALALIGHEMGHFIMPFLEAKAPFFDAFKATIAAAVAAAGGTKGDADMWTRWAPEIFADWFAVVSIGGPAVWAIGQYELADDARMQKPKTYYPSAQARLFLLSEFARMHQLTPIAALEGLTAPATGSQEQKIATAIAASTTKPIAGVNQTLAQLVSFRQPEHEDQPAERAPVALWAEAMRDGGDQAISRDARHARLLASASARAWRDATVADNDATQTQQMQNIRDRAFKWVAESAENETRAGGPAVKPPEKTLASRLIDVSDETLFGAGGAA
jgi:hypothetical protein